MTLENHEPLSATVKPHPRSIASRNIDELQTADIFESPKMGATFGDGYEIASIGLQVVDDLP